jgi:hypothetical protein
MSWRRVRRTRWLFFIHTRSFFFASTSRGEAEKVVGKGT